MPRTPRVPQVMVLIETSRAYGRLLVRGIGRYVSEHGPWSIYFEERGLRDPLPSWVNDWHGDGIISRTRHEAKLNKLLATKLPLVELYADPQRGLPCVYPRFDRIADLAAEHLLGLGLREFAFFCTEHAWWTEVRRDDFTRVLQEQGYGCSCYSARSLQAAGSGHEAQERRIFDWLEALPKPCGIFCGSDFYAMWLLDICRSQSIAVPEQIAVLGVDNDQVICSVSFPPLSSIDLASPRIGYEAAALLDRLMAGDPPENTTILVEPGQVVHRQSTDILAIEDVEVARAVRFIREHASRGISVQDVADAVATSRRGLERRFLRTLQRSPKEEITRTRMERAKMLLRQTDIPIETVSRQSGFASFKYFAKAFSRAAGVTPRTFRKECRVPGLDSATES